MAPEKQSKQLGRMVTCYPQYEVTKGSVSIYTIVPRNELQSRLSSIDGRDGGSSVQPGV